MNISILTAYLLSGSPAELPKPDRDAVTKFDLLQSRAITHAGTATDKQKKDVRVAINNRLLFASEGIQLINDLNVLQRKNNRINFHIFLNFGTMPIDPLTERPREAKGFTDIELPEEEDDDAGAGRLRKDIPLYFIYQPDHDSGEFNYPVEENVDVALTIKRASSRMSLTIFHELLHVLFIEISQDPDKSGHGVAGAGGIIPYDKPFIERIRRFRQQVIEIEKAVSKQ